MRKAENQRTGQSPSLRFMSPQSLQTELLSEAETTKNVNYKDTFEQQFNHLGKSNQVKFSKVNKGAEMATALATHTSFRFNASHELLQFNQEQVNKILPQTYKQGSQVDKKLLNIRKLKEKALMIQLSREVNKPNAYLAS